MLPFVVLIATAWVARGASLPQPKGFIYFLADDLGIGETSPYGQRAIETPSFARLASEGLRATRATTGAPICTPSRATLLTGRTALSASLRGNRAVPCADGWFHQEYSDRCDSPLLEGVKRETLPWLLRDHAGFVTAHFGKSMLGENGSVATPPGLGFDRSFVTLDGARGWCYNPPFQWSSDARREAGPEGMEFVPITNNSDQSFPGCQPWLCKGVFNASGHGCVYNQDLYLSQALQFLDDWSAGGYNGLRGKPTTASPPPFFMYFASHLPHADCAFDSDRVHGWGEPVKSDGPYHAENWTQPERNHAAMVSYLDSILGALMSKLDDLGIADSVVLWATSDNGASNQGGRDYRFHNASGPFRGCKGCTFRGGYSEPHILRWPEAIAKGSTTDMTFAGYDVLPTLLEAAGVPPTSLPPTIQGESILSHITQEPLPNGSLPMPAGEPRLMVWNVVGGCGPKLSPFKPPIAKPTCCYYNLAAERWPWKVRWRNNKSYAPELYNLDEDIHETHDLYDKEPSLAQQIIAEAEAKYLVEDDLWPTAPCPGEHWSSPCECDTPNCVNG